MPMEAQQFNLVARIVIKYILLWRRNDSSINQVIKQLLEENINLYTNWENNECQKKNWFLWHGFQFLCSGHNILNTFTLNGRFQYQVSEPFHKFKRMPLRPTVTAWLAAASPKNPTGHHSWNNLKLMKGLKFIDIFWQPLSSPCIRSVQDYRFFQKHPPRQASGRVNLLQDTLRALFYPRCSRNCFRPLSACLTDEKNCSL